MIELLLCVPEEVAADARDAVRRALAELGLTVADQDGRMVGSVRSEPGALMLEIVRAKRVPLGAWTQSPPVCGAGEVAEVLGHLDTGAAVWVVRDAGGDVGWIVTPVGTPVTLAAGACPSPTPRESLTDEQQRRILRDAS